MTRKVLTSSAGSSSDCRRRSSWCDRVGRRFGSTSTRCHDCSATTLSRSDRRFRRPMRSFAASAITIAPTTARPCSVGSTNWTLRTFCKWVGRRSGKMTAGKAYRQLTLVNGQKFTMPTAYTPAGKMVSLLSHSRFHRLRFQQVKGTNSPLDPRLAEYWEERREQALFRRAMADAQQTADASPQAATLPVRHHRLTAGRYVRNRHSTGLSPDKPVAMTIGAICVWFSSGQKPTCTTDTEVTDNWPR